MEQQAADPTRDAVFAVIDAMFRKHNWHFLRDMEGDFWITLNRVQMILRYIEPLQALVLFAGVREADKEAGPIAADHLLAITRLLLDMNFRIVIGKLGRDEQDGEIRFEATAPLAGGPMTEEILDLLFAVAISTVKETRERITALLEESPASGSLKL